MPKYLTKSRFKLACDCPAKLYYTGKNEYVNNNEEDSFLEALAEGGFQVGELAKLYFPGGLDVKSLGYDEALAETYQELEKEECIIYEAAIKFEELFIRIDVLHKKDNHLYLYEVKAKSAMPDETFCNKKGYLDNGWKPYVYDAAFQHYVVQKAFPDAFLHTHLSLIDKSSIATVDGLNQLFKIKKDGRTSVEVHPEAYEKDLGAPLIHHFFLNDLITKIMDGEHVKDKDEWEEIPFIERIQLFSEAYAQDNKLNVPVSKACKSCEFRATTSQLEAGAKSGFHECWMAQTPLTMEQLEQPMVYDLWAGNMGRNTVFNDMIANQRYFLKDITYQDVVPKGGVKEKEFGLEPVNRRMLQVDYHKQNIQEPYFDVEGYLQEKSTWRYPLHFIDFETSMVAIPFHAGRRPYEQMAFQFSHHQMEEDGTYSHKSEFLHIERGQFPNYDFLRALKKALTKDEGTIFRYSNHENTVLNQIRVQLVEDPTVEDKEELIDFIDSITHHKERGAGYRDMVDQWDLVKLYFYDQTMGGSNSIKAVLPTVLQKSVFLREKYKQPIYGSTVIPSHNFSEKAWLEFDNKGQVINPYYQLEPVFEEYGYTLDDRLSSLAGIKGGGDAMTAWAYMQFGEMSDEEHQQLAKGLLRYCELDTLAMVMIHEYWEDLVKKHG